MHRSHPFVALAVAFAIGGFTRPAFAQDFRVLRDTVPPDPAANLAPALVPAELIAPRLLIAGDSWAQYMWDDGSHNRMFDRFGHAEKRAVSRSLGSDPGPGYSGPEYAVSGSEARQWANTASYPWIANVVAELQANPTIDRVLLSIGGNDVLAGRSGGGWYKQMDLDVPGSEAALFNTIHTHTVQIIDAALAVRPGLRVIVSSYDYPNFNTGFWCFAYACPKRQDLSRDPNNALVTDQELNAMIVDVEQDRIGWTNAHARCDFDHAVGLMHYIYGDGVAAPLTLPRPGQVPPAYNPFPGGNPQRPSLRSVFRNAADPIHLDLEGYEYKIAHETQGTFLPLFRGNAAATFFSVGGAEDGWTDGATMGTTAIRLGDNGTTPLRGMISFDTSSLPDNATVTGARLYLTREGLTGTNPFTSGALGTPTVDVRTGTFGAAAVEVADAGAAATATDAGWAIGSLTSNGYALAIDLRPAGLAAINRTGRTQLRVSFPQVGSSAGADYVAMSDGDVTAPPAGFPTLASYMGTSAPFMDVTYTLPVAVGETPAGRARVLPASPNPFRVSTSIRFELAQAAPVRLEIFDIRGARVATLMDGRTLPAGGHATTWDGRDRSGRLTPAGVYLVRLESGGGAWTGRVARLE
ncbi:MAG TPA: FlgD immunoglobulin-like domain containing protein [Candidatus Eisenbacteria bacterium]|nr:FlgD immunoglobulin-like domain containing protein [Candidatus Eisenbacteria bacterium]